MIGWEDEYVKFKLLKKVIKKITLYEVQGLLTQALEKHTAFMRMLDANIDSVQRFYFCELQRLEKRGKNTIFPAMDELATAADEEKARDEELG